MEQKQIETKLTKLFSQSSQNELRNKLSQLFEIKEKINRYISLSDKHKNAYFWSSPSHASARRNYEKKNSFTFESQFVYHNELKTKVKFQHFSLKCRFAISCSCKNVYVYKETIINDKSTNIKRLKSILKFLKTEINNISQFLEN